MSKAGWAVIFLVFELSFQDAYGLMEFEPGDPGQFKRIGTDREAEEEKRAIFAAQKDSQKLFIKPIAENLVETVTLPLAPKESRAGEHFLILLVIAATIGVFVWMVRDGQNRVEV